jgi:hypothetical protein
MNGLSAKVRVAAQACGVPLVLAALTALPACQRPLFDPNEGRSQYDRYDGIRAQYAPQFIENEYGQRIPNLRARLSPKE